MSRAARVRSIPSQEHQRAEREPEVNAGTRGRLVRGRLVELDEGGRVRVDWGAGQVAAALLATNFSDRVLLQAIRSRSEVLLDFLDGQPVILGLLRDRLEIDPADARGAKEAHAVLEGTESVTIACGKSAIELHEDGRVSVRGTHVASISSGVSLVEGSPVRIN
jgi:hypothetical protein